MDKWTKLNELNKCVQITTHNNTYTWMKLMKELIFLGGLHEISWGKKRKELEGMILIQCLFVKFSANKWIPVDLKELVTGWAEILRECRNQFWGLVPKRLTVFLQCTRKHQNGINFGTCYNWEIKIFEL